MRLVPQPVIFGFVNGLAIIIGGSQLSQFQTDEGHWLAGTDLAVFGALVLVAMAIIAFLPKLTKAVPGGLTAILVIFGSGDRSWASTPKQWAIWPAFKAASLPSTSPKFLLTSRR